MANIFEQVILASQSGASLTESTKSKRVGARKLQEGCAPKKLVEKHPEMLEHELREIVDSLTKQ